MVKFSIVDPSLLAQFCAEILQDACCEYKREAFERIYALALFYVARDRMTMEINGRLAIDYTNWLLNGQ